MNRESRVAAKYKKIAGPLVKKRDLFMILYSIFLFPALICIIGYVFIPSIKDYCVIGAIVCFIPFMILLLIQDYYDRKSKPLEMTYRPIEEYIEELNLTDVQIEELDRIIEDSEKSICGIKCGGSCITFTKNLVVEYVRSKTLVKIFVEKTPDINYIEHSIEKDYSTYVFFTHKSNHFSHLTVSVKSGSSDEEDLKAYIKEYLPSADIFKD